MFKRIVLAVALCLLAVPVMAQEAMLEDLSITVGIGGAVPARWEEFTEDYKPAFYRVLNAEYAVSKTLSIYGAYDRSIFQADTEAKAAGAQTLDVTAWGVGSLVFFPLSSNTKLKGFAKIGGMSNTIEGQGTEWTFPAGVGVNWDFSEAASIRFGCDFRTLSDSDQLESLLFSTALNLRPAKVGK